MPPCAASTAPPSRAAGTAPPSSAASASLPPSAAGTAPPSPVRHHRHRVQRARHRRHRLPLPHHQARHIHLRQCAIEYSTATLCSEHGIATIAFGTQAIQCGAFIAAAATSPRTALPPLPRPSHQGRHQRDPRRLRHRTQHRHLQAAPASTPSSATPSSTTATTLRCAALFPSSAAHSPSSVTSPTC